MSDTLANLRQKIERAGDLRSVVSTMKALAAVSIGQYEKSVRSLHEYYHAVELGLSVCLSTKAPFADVADVADVMDAPVEWKIKKDAGVTGALVFGSDQGLVGQFNDVLADYAVHTLAALAGKTKIWAVGERVHDRLADRGVPLAGRLTVPFSLKAVTPLVGQILAKIILPGLTRMEEREERESRARSARAEQSGGKNELHTLYLFYNSSRSGEIYEPVNQQLLPLDETWRSRLAKLPWPTKNLPEVLGSEPDTLRALVREYLFVSLFRACAESLASENASRLAAMERAERNIDQLSEDLRKTFYRLRQSKIDEELFDVIAGVEALKGTEQQKGRTRV